jgi:hypothetical protein
MAIDYANLSAQLGEMYDAIVEMETFGATLEARRVSMLTAMNVADTTDMLGDVNQLFTNAKNSVNTMLSSVVSLAKKRIVHKISILDELPSLTAKDYNSVVYELIDDMIANSETIKKSTLTVSAITKTATNSNTGDLIVTKKLPGNEAPGQGMYAHIGVISTSTSGIDSELTLTDSFVVTVQNDSQSSGGGNETFVITSLPSMQGSFNVNGGGNTGTKYLSQTKPQSLISNFFASFSGTVPVGWTALDSTDYAEETSIVMFAGTSCLRVVSAGTLSYNFSSSARAGQVLSLSMYVRRHASETGSLNIRVYANSTLVVNQNITSGSTSSSAWTLFNYVVPITKEVGTCYIEIISSSITNAYYIDNGALSPFTYHAGLGFAVTKGTGIFVKGDDFRFTTTNNNAGKLQRLFARVFGYQPPTATAGSETISDP